jgi:hypothetical protein
MESPVSLAKIDRTGLAPGGNLASGLLPLSSWIQVAGVVQLAIGLANLPLARRLQYRKNLAGASSIVRQVFYVHAVYIVLVVLGFAALSLLFPAELAGGQPLGRFLSGFLAVFWLLRVPIQLLYYPTEIRRQNRLADVVFTVAFAFLAVVFGLAAVR